MTEPLDITICVPTFNRAKDLGETLERVFDNPIKFKKIMVSDNASQDDTASVLEKFKKKHDNFDYKINKTNVGPMLNFHSLLSSSDTTFQYILSDDDILYHDNIQMGVEFLTENDFMSAFYGTYDAEVENLNKDMRSDVRVFNPLEYSKEVIIFDKHNFLENIKMAPMLHPIYRTEAYKRYCGFDQYSFGFWKQMMQLLNYGPFIFYPISLFGHQATEGRLEHQVHTPWYYNQAMADYELMLAQSNDPQLIPELRQLMIARLQPFHYEYGYNDAAHRLADPLLSHHYLMRMKGHGELKEGLFKHWERAMLIPAIAKKLAEVISSSVQPRLLIQNTITRADELAEALAREVPGLPIEAAAFDTPAEAFRIFGTWDDLCRYRETTPISNRDYAVFDDIKASFNLA